MRADFYNGNPRFKFINGIDIVNLNMKINNTIKLILLTLIDYNFEPLYYMRYKIKL